MHERVSSPHQVAYADEHGVVPPTKTIALEAAAMSCDVNPHAVCQSCAPTPLVGAQIDARAAQCSRTAESVVADLLLGRNAVERSLEGEHVATLVTSVRGPGAWTTTGAAIPTDASSPAN